MMTTPDHATNPPTETLEVTIDTNATELRALLALSVIGVGVMGAKVGITRAGVELLEKYDIGPDEAIKAIKKISLMLSMGIDVTAEDLPNA